MNTKERQAVNPESDDDETIFTGEENEPSRSGKFDHRNFWKIMGAGVGLSLFGIFLIASTKSVPANLSGSGFVSEIQRIMGVLPDTTKDLLEFILGNLLLLLGVYCIFLSLKILVRYTAGRRL